MSVAHGGWIWGFLGDGVIVVPAAHIEEVAKYARQEAVNDKRGRRKMW